jgi:DNA primase
MIPQDFIDTVMARTDILEVVKRYVPTMKKVGKDYVGLCPFHAERTPSFTVAEQKQFYHCFGCGAHGSAIGFLMDYAGTTFPDAVRQLATEAGLEMPGRSEEMIAEAQRQKRQNDLLEAAAAFFRQQLRITPGALAYLQQRRLQGETLARFGLGYAPADPQRFLDAFPGMLGLLEDCGLVFPQAGTGEVSAFFRDRIMFPIRNARGRLVGFAGRVLHEAGEVGRKYQNSPETALFQKRRELYGLAEALPAIKQAGYALCVEGYMDVLKLHEHNIANVVAGMGTSFTADQLALLYRYTNRIVFCFDGDGAGLRASRRALDAVLPELIEGRQANFVLLPKDEDPDTLVMKEKDAGFLARVAAAPTALDFLFQQLAREHPGEGPEAKAAFVAAARESLAKVGSPLLRAAAAARMAEITQIDADALRSALRRSAPLPAAVGAASPARTLLRLAVFAPAAAAGLTDLVPDEDGADSEALRALLGWVKLHAPQTTEELLALAADSPHAERLAALAAGRAEWPGDPAHDLAQAAQRYREQRAGAREKESRLASLRARFAAA